MKEKIAILSILANVILAGSKIFIGFISHSASVLAEGFHSLTDIFSSLIGYFGIRASQKPLDQEHPYGHYKLEVLSGAVITLILLVTGAGIIYEAYKNFLSPGEIKVNYLTFSIMIFSVLVNFVTARIKIYYGKKENSLTLLSDGTHDKADVLASLAVLFGLGLSKYWVYADSILAIVIGLYIIKESFSLGKEAVDSLLDVSAGVEIEEKIKAIVQKENVQIYSLKTQRKGSAITANLEIEIANDLNIEAAVKISNNLREKLTTNIENLQYVAIQIKSYEVSSGFYKPAFGQSFNWQGKGPEGDCICLKCGYLAPHQKGVPCSSCKCPQCRINLERK